MALHTVDLVVNSCSTCVIVSLKSMQFQHGLCDSSVWRCGKKLFHKKLFSPSPLSTKPSPFSRTDHEFCLPETLKHWLECWNQIQGQGSFIAFVTLKCLPVVTLCWPHLNFPGVNCFSPTGCKYFPNKNTWALWKSWQCCYEGKATH